jgi:hypothetical protein
MEFFDLTLITKHGGPLTKRIHLDGDHLANDSSACVMSRGRAERFQFATAQQLADLIGSLDSSQALALGALPLGSDQYEVVTKRRMNSAAGMIARSNEFFAYREGAPAWALLDFDKKGMPEPMVHRLDAMGGVWAALTSIIPEFADVACVERQSTSTGLYRTDTGEQFPGSGGRHFYVTVKDGADIERFLKTLHERCWLKGFGWMMVGAGGQLLERSIIDRVVGGPERLSFEGAPIVEPPLDQDQKARRPIATEGIALDTVAACPPLTILEEAQVCSLRAKEKVRLAPERARAREVFIDRQSKSLAARTGMNLPRARKTVERWVEGILLPDVVLEFDDSDITGITVADVLADPSRYEGETLADPLEGIAYGRGKAKIMRRSDGSLWIHSFAHGGINYELKLDFHAVKAKLESAAKDEAADLLTRLVADGDLDHDEIEELRILTVDKTGINRRTLTNKLKSARQRAGRAKAEQARDRRLAERKDPRPQFDLPANDAEWSPVMGLLNSVLGSCRADEPPMRDTEGYITEVESRLAADLHTLTAYGSNNEDTDKTRIPPPEHQLLTRLEQPEVAELIEQHIEFVNDRGKACHLGDGFVKHFIKRKDGELPRVTGVCTTPLLLPNGELLTGPGLLRSVNTVFRAPTELLAWVPKLEECTPGRVAGALRFLTHEWLADVSCDYAGRCVLVACALSILERQVLPQRPGFFITAGKRGGGKTTAANMITVAALGLPAAAAAWSSVDEERRKALFSYLLEGMPALVWDNIARGTTIFCPHIEKALTALTYTDRILQLSKRGSAPATTIQIFTGNNIGPRGDLASRVLQTTIEVTRPDPENRTFKHPDPIGWTKANRGKIMRAFYTILLGNPRRHGERKISNEPDIEEWQGKEPPTRFKEWWDMIGSAIEYAGKHVLVENVDAPETDCKLTDIDFKNLLLDGEEADEETAGLAGLLIGLQEKFPVEFRARELSDYLDPPLGTTREDAAQEMLVAFNRASGNVPMRIITPSAVSARLKKLVKAPVKADSKTTLILRCNADRKNGDTFTVEEMGGSNGPWRPSNDVSPGEEIEI